MKLQVTILDPRKDGATIRLAWTAVADRMRATELGHDVEWFWANLDWFSPRERDLRFLAVTDSGQPIALLPLEKRRVQAGPLPIPVLGFIEHPAAPAGTALLVSGHHDAVGDAFVACLGDGYRSWRCLSLEGLEYGSPWERTVRQKLASRAVAVEREQIPECYLDFSGSWEQFLASRRPKLRQLHRRFRQTLQSMGCIYSERVGGTSMNLDVLEQIDRNSWRIDKRESWEKNDSLLRYCQVLHEIYPGARSHMLRCLAVDGKAIAGFYGLRHGDVLYAIKLNYDRTYEDHSPGMVLLAEVIRESFGMGVARMEVRTRTAFARRMTNATRQLSKTLMFNRRSSGAMLVPLLRFGIIAKRRWTKASVSA